MSAYDEYAKSMKESGELQKQSQELSTKAQMDQLAENKKLIEAEKQNAFRGAYVDYAKNINPYGVQSELVYGAGLGGAGKGETAQANYYNTYQNRLGEINTNTTNQLRDIANQETSVRLAGDQAKLDIATTYGQQLADAKYARDQQLESYARQDKADNKNYLMSMISSTGYTPSDEQLAAAGMTRDEANALQGAYRQSLYSGSSGSSVKYDTMSADHVNKLTELQQNGDFKGYWDLLNNLTNTYNYDPDVVNGWMANVANGAVSNMSQDQRKQYYASICADEGKKVAEKEVWDAYAQGFINGSDYNKLMIYVSKL